MSDQIDLPGADELLVSFQGELIRCQSLAGAQSLAAANEALARLHECSPDELLRFSSVLREHGKFDESYRLGRLAVRRLPR